MSVNIRERLYQAVAASLSALMLRAFSLLWAAQLPLGQAVPIALTLAFIEIIILWVTILFPQESIRKKYIEEICSRALRQFQDFLSYGEDPNNLFSHFERSLREKRTARVISDQEFTNCYLSLKENFETAQATYSAQRITRARDTLEDKIPRQLKISEENPSQIMDIHSE